MTFYLKGRILVAVAMLALTGCAKGEDAAQAAAAAAGAPKSATEALPRPASTYFPVTLGGVELRVQLAVTAAEMQRGLMGRAFIGEKEGMVFFFEKPQRMNFWMRNTPSPLDIGYFKADGILGEVYPLYPFDETPVSSVAEDYSLALEVNQGWFAKNGIKPGAKINLAELVAALRARGFKPESYGLPVEKAD